MLWMLDTMVELQMGQGSQWCGCEALSKSSGFSGIDAVLGKTREHEGIVTMHQLNLSLQDTC